MNQLSPEQHQRDLSALLWIWRVAVLLALVWIGYEVHQVNRRMPTGLDYDTEQSLRRIDSNVSTITKAAQDTERNTRK